MKQINYLDAKFRTGSVPPVLKKAVKFGRKKRVLSIESFNSSADSTKRTAFGAAGDLSTRGASQILKAANTAIGNGLSFRDFKKNIPPEIFDKIAAPEIVFKNQAIDTYQRSRFNQQTRLTPLRPFWKYVTFGDDRVRPNHRIMNGVVSPAGSSFWDNNYPPNGHQCRCLAQALNERQVRQQNLTVYPNQGAVTKAKLTEQKNAGIPFRKRVTPIADRGGWRTSYKPGELGLDTIRNAYKDFSPERFASVLNKSKATKAKIAKAEADKIKIDNPIDDPKPLTQEARLRETEGVIQNRGTEYASIVESDGTPFIFTDKKGETFEILKGKKNSVPISRPDFLAIKKLNNPILTHNHPNGLTLSTADVQVLIQYKLKEIRAVGKKYLYRISKTADTDEAKVFKAYSGAWKRRLRKKENEFLKETGKWPEADEWGELLHETHVEISEKYKLNYSREVF